MLSGAGLCVGPRMKLPSSLTGAFAPSGSSFALTYPDVFGSRVGDGGRAGRAAAAAAAGASAGVGVWARAVKALIRNAELRRRNIRTPFALKILPQHPSPRKSLKRQLSKNHYRS